MSAFHDLVALDRSVFLNLDEFGETHDVDGGMLQCVIDTDADAEKAATVASPYEGVFDNSKRVFFRTEDYAPPAVGKQVQIDGSWHIVTRVSREMTITVMTAVEVEGGY